MSDNGGRGRCVGEVVGKRGNLFEIILFKRREFRWLMETEYAVKVTAIERLMKDLATRFACVLQPTSGQSVV